MDDLALCSTNPEKLKNMIDMVQNWSERSRLLINADKSQVMCFNETKVQRESKTPGRGLAGAPFTLVSAFPSPTTHELVEVTEFDYLGLRIDHELIMKRAVALIIEKAESALNSILATGGSLRYDKHHGNPNLARLPATASLPLSVLLALPKNRERSYRKWLQKQATFTCPSAAPCLKWLHTSEPVAPIFLRFSASVPSPVWIGSPPTCTTIEQATSPTITTDFAPYALTASSETSSTSLMCVLKPLPLLCAAETPSLLSSAYATSLLSTPSTPRIGFASC